MQSDLLDNILLTSSVTDNEGQNYPVHSHTALEQCKFMQKIIKDVKPANSLEIGFAYGISTLAILAALNNEGA